MCRLLNTISSKSNDNPVPQHHQFSPSPISTTLQEEKMIYTQSLFAQETTIEVNAIHMTLLQDQVTVFQNQIIISSIQ